MLLTHEGCEGSGQRPGRQYLTLWENAAVRAGRAFTGGKRTPQGFTRNGGESSRKRPARRQRDRNRRAKKRVLHSMRLAFVVVLFFVFLAWDIAENNGHYTHMISSKIGDLGRQLGLQ